MNPVTNEKYLSRKKYFSLRYFECVTKCESILMKEGGKKTTWKNHKEEKKKFSEYNWVD